MNTVINRLQAVLSSPEDYTILDGDRYESERRRLSSLLGLGLGDSASPSPTASVDLASESLESIADHLRSLPVPTDGQVLVLWPYARVGAWMRMKALLETLDELWLPGGDDVWVTDAAHEWLIVLDHEERLSFYAPHR